MRLERDADDNALENEVDVHRYPVWESGGASSQNGLMHRLENAFGSSLPGHQFAVLKCTAVQSLRISLKNSTFSLSPFEKVLFRTDSYSSIAERDSAQVFRHVTVAWSVRLWSVRGLSVRMYLCRLSHSCTCQSRWTE